ncbi:formate dehydrogenase subunit gamma [Siccirubricoccus sp. KC 17139]|uniref:Formate dehydrogenase subunit gamma n=1 Tax=Siccirubricoccus soli TaxID=2899147 RepID=A0ABT1D7K1_9PROT|nr:formate dehydrogenase subunit gamma [Siccirubricoccus soli]MCO6417235.1 formate dehydrogenase subunit gamma [Siccirubricoccus soli]MCP2683370.1 formate dehydrogenase subunit gamma [Siccirubricoccus soli]
MSRALLGAALALSLLAGGAQAQQTSGQPSGGAPEVQAPVPEVGAGRGRLGSGQVPQTTEPQAPTGAPDAPPVAAAPTPVTPIPAPPPLGDRDQADAAELELQATLRGQRISGRISIPNATAANLIQPAGREWREFHNRILTWVGGVAVLGMLVILAGFFLVKGRIRPEAGMSGRTLLRFNLLERANHWMVASCFVVLALSGLNLTFGRHVLLPVIGPEAFTAVSAAGKIAHNFLAFPFTLGLVVMFLLWVRDNIPNRLDIEWVKKGGGFIGRGHPQARRFNAGQKGMFWITILGGGLVAASGYVLVFPFTVTDIAGQQWAHVVHGLLTVLMIAAILAHIYIGSIGMEGAIDAMTTGQVDENWAREHHSLWLEEERVKARAPVPGAKPAGAG